jgi:hypothetical protein
MAGSEAMPQRFRIAAARERADKAKTAMLAAALIAFFVTMGFERGGHHSTSGTSQAPVTSESSDDGSGFLFDNGGLSQSQGTPSTSTNTS